MGWIRELVRKVRGAEPTDWMLVDDLEDPGIGVGSHPIDPDDCYVELYVESIRLEKARRFATKFHGVVYSFVSVARQGTDRAELASLTKPQDLANVDPSGLDRVITVSRRITAAMPWRGNPLGLELGLFSVESGNMMSPLLDYVTRISDKAGISIPVKLDPFLPLITEGLDLIAGQTEDTEIELALDTDISLGRSHISALIATPKNALDRAHLAIDPSDCKLLYRGNPLDAAYCVFSIRRSDRNPDWGAIDSLQAAYRDFNRAILEGKRKDAEEALAAFNRQVIVSPDLIQNDKDRLKELARMDLVAAFPGGGQSASGERRRRFEGRVLSDLQLYGS